MDDKNISIKEEFQVKEDDFIISFAASLVVFLYFRFKLLYYTQREKICQFEMGLSFHE